MVKIKQPSCIYYALLYLLGIEKMFNEETHSYTLIYTQRHTHANPWCIRFWQTRKYTLQIDTFSLIELQSMKLFLLSTTVSWSVSIYVAKGGFLRCRPHWFYLTSCQRRTISFLIQENPFCSCLKKSFTTAQICVKIFFLGWWWWWWWSYSESRRKTKENSSKVGDSFSFFFFF